MLNEKNKYYLRIIPFAIFESINAIFRAKKRTLEKFVNLLTNYKVELKKIIIMKNIMLYVKSLIYIKDLYLFKVFQVTEFF